MTKKFFWAFVRSIIVTVVTFVALAKLKPADRGFVCNDPSLSYVRKIDTVGDGKMAFYGLIFPLIFIFGSEIIFNRKKYDSFKDSLYHSWSQTAYLYGNYFIILSFGNILMVTAKLSTGAHRPHFFATCVPDTTNCTTGTLISEFQCTNKGDSFYGAFSIKDASMSFFSGHAQYANYSSLFLVFYLKYRVKKSQFVIPFLQSLLISVAYFISISRVFDNRHTVVDITVGSVMGSLQAIFLWFVQCKNFKPHEEILRDKAEALPLKV